MAVSVTIFTDPFDPWSWASEPHRRRLEVEFGDQVELTFVMVGMHRRIERPAELALAALDAAAESGMPADPRVFLRDPPASTHPAALAFHAVAEQGGAARYLRRLREAIMLEGRRMDAAPALLDAAREIGGIDLERLRVAFGSNAILEALGADLERAGAAHREPGAERVAIPSLEARGADGAVRGAYGWGSYERWRDAVVAAGAAPGRARPGVEEALRRFGALATVEVAAACELPGPRAPAELWRLALEWRVRRRGKLWELA
jgi:predicted DsbA family dithiol-disulfide isomerase